MGRRVPVDLGNYPNLAKLSKEEFLPLMKGLFVMADKAVELGHLEIAEEYFYCPYHEVVSEILSGFFDTESILKNHNQPETAQFLFDLYKHAEHPLHAALSEIALVDKDGEEITFEDKFATKRKDFNIKQWVEGLLFFAWYTNLKDYANALSANNYKLIDEVKTPYLPRLLQIQPVLKKQQEHGVLPGKLIPGTGFFDVAVPAEELDDHCVVCDSINLVERDTYIGCRECKAGYRKE